MTPQMGLDLGHELVVDLFAGGGGASWGIENGIGRPVDIAVNHDPQAVTMHQANHPNTQHYCESVFDVKPLAVTGGQPVGLLWASPDCTHHSKAKGGKPVSANRRGLAWVVVDWARDCAPRVIMLENVEEFEDWGPLDESGRPCPVRKGETFREWVQALEDQGYTVDWRQLRACDYGTPTIRRRLFVIARRDGRKIVWPKPSHGAPDSLPVRRGSQQPFRTAAQCIDWSIPCPSIFERKRPLAENTMRRIAEGMRRFVLESDDPFLVSCDEGLAAPTLVGIDHGGARTGCSWSAREPLTTTTTENRHALVTAFLAKHFTGVVGTGLHKPAATVTARDHHALVSAYMLNLKGTQRSARSAEPPISTTCAGATHAGLVAAFMAPYYGSGSGETGRDLRDPAPTTTAKDRLQLVTVTIDGETYVVTDIGMRMLQPRELFRANGFPDNYIIAPEWNGKPLPKYAQTRMCGNSVPPQWPEVLVGANFRHEQRIAGSHPTENEGVA